MRLLLGALLVGSLLLVLPSSVSATPEDPACPMPMDGEGLVVCIKTAPQGHGFAVTETDVGIYRNGNFLGLFSYQETWTDGSGNQESSGSWGVSPILVVTNGSLEPTCVYLQSDLLTCF